MLPAPLPLLLQTSGGGETIGSVRESSPVGEPISPTGERFGGRPGLVRVFYSYRAKVQVQVSDLLAYARLCCHWLARERRKGERLSGD